MPTDPRWNLDPTEQTTRLPSSTAGDVGPFATAKLPDISVRTPTPWYRRRGVIIGASAAVVLIVFGVVVAAAAPSPKNDRVADPPLGTTATVPTPAVSSSPVPRTTSRTRVQSSPATAGSWRMPNEVGQVLQDAQDDLQRVSGDAAFYSDSHDLLGDRFQILDRDWKVCTQNVPRGTRVSATATIDFGVVKVDETCP